MLDLCLVSRPDRLDDRVERDHGRDRRQRRNVGRRLDDGVPELLLEDLGKLDNTLIIYISGDNGTSPEGTTLGTPDQYAAYNGILEIPVAEQLKFYEAWGSPATYPHMAVAWAWAFDTPFKWTKQVASHFGGTRQGMAISWPARIKPSSTTSSTSCPRSSTSRV